MAKFFLSYLANPRQKSSMGAKKSLLHNKIILYLLLAASFIQLFLLTNTKKYMAAVSFIVIAAAMLFFTRNMIVVLVFALAISAVLGVFGKFTVKQEGFEGNEDEEEKKEGMEDNKKKGGMEKNEKKNNKKDDKGNKKKHDTDSGNNDKQLMDQLQEQGEQLIGIQQKVMKNFQAIQPSIDRVESLVSEINQTAANLSPTFKEMFSKTHEQSEKKK